MGAEAEAMPQEMTGLARMVAAPELVATLAVPMGSEAILAMAAKRAAAGVKKASGLAGHRSRAHSGPGNDGSAQPVGV